MGVAGVIMMIRAVWWVNWSKKFWKVGVGRHFGEEMLCSCSFSSLSLFGTLAALNSICRLTGCLCCRLGLG